MYPLEPVLLTTHLSACGQEIPAAFQLNLSPLTLFANTVSVGQGAMSSPEELRGDRGAAVMERL